MVARVLKLYLSPLLKQVISRVKQTGSFDVEKTALLGGIWAAGMFAVAIGGAGNPTGYGIFIDIFVYITLHSVLFIAAVSLVGIILSLLFIPVPRLTVGALFYTFALCYWMLEEANIYEPFAAFFSGIYTNAAFALGLLAALIKTPTLNAGIKTAGAAIPAAMISLFLFYSPSIEHEDPGSSFDHMGAVTPIDELSPAADGVYKVDHFTYGNGEDRHRERFADSVGVVTNTVNASAYIDDWEDRRTKFWGFDETELPLNGEVWMPDTEEAEKHPLVLMVHGNHRMENFSEGGYEYLGEMLASQGFIAVSVDQNFLNYSGWSGIPDDDYWLRAWFLLHHLNEIAGMSSEPGNPFFERTDLESTALIGHSRGGQAAAMVGDYERWFADEPAAEVMADVDVQSIISLAPTDTQVDDQRPELFDTSYLSIHGALDGDVHNFHGDRQYGRVNIEPGSDHKRVGVYIAGANHSQFNTDWGRMDMRLPGGLLLNREQLLEPDEQQEAAKVYISAFLRSTLTDERRFDRLFRDPRYGADWLPDTKYVTRMEDGAYQRLVDFNQAENDFSFAGGVSLEADGFDLYDVRQAVNRSGNRKRTEGAVVQFQADGLLSFDLPDDNAEDVLAGEYETFALSMANLDRKLNDEKEEFNFNHVPQVEAVLVMNNGEKKSAALEPFDQIAASIHTQYTRIPAFDDYMREDKYAEAIEPVFGLYEWPLGAFSQEEEVDLSELDRIELRFTDGPGKLMIDDIGFFKK
ncbi:hypothetical protein SAMN05444126_13110 [Salisediminibacterium halotolerans]|uniref:Chlorophyllase enzyme n=1 Tax=Salisediminibacterium halotolerans TaxID=517425 RepID=A0A1H9WAH9_9BACI|nr:hypothetical protein SAMN05444126_13110 [Salisediminibacterium haloalkalitolerans]